MICPFAPPVWPRSRYEEAKDDDERTPSPLQPGLQRPLHRDPGADHSGPCRQDGGRGVRDARAIPATPACAREPAWGLAGRDPSFAILRERRALASLRGLAKTYTLTSNGWLSETDGATQVPVTVESRETRILQMLLAAEPATMGVEVSVVFAGRTTNCARTRSLTAPSRVSG